MSLPMNWRKVVRDMIVECIKRDGVPIFRTRYGGVMLCRGNVCRVIMVCWGGGRGSGGHVYVPRWLAEELDKRRGDFLYLANILGIDMSKLLKEIRERGSV